MDKYTMAKENIPVAMAVSGGAMTWTPSMIISVLGLVIGAAGIVLGLMQQRSRVLDREAKERATEATNRATEASRAANDIELKKLEWDKQKHATSASSEASGTKA